MSRSHLGSFRPTPIRRLLAFMGISLAVHAVLLLGTSIPWLLADEEPSAAAEPSAGEPQAAAPPAAEQSSAPAASGLPTVPKPTANATDAYLERVGGAGDADRTETEAEVDGLDGLEAFE